MRLSFLAKAWQMSGVASVEALSEIISSKSSKVWSSIALTAAGRKCSPLRTGSPIETRGKENPGADTFSFEAGLRDQKVMSLGPRGSEGPLLVATVTASPLHLHRVSELELRCLTAERLFERPESLREAPARESACKDIANKLLASLWVFWCAQSERVREGTGPWFGI